MKINNEILVAAEKLYSFLRVSNTIMSSDAILLLGGHDTLVVRKVAELYKAGLAKTIIVSGGSANIPKRFAGRFDNEAEAFAEELYLLGIPKEVCLLEKEARNTSENFTLTMRLLSKINLSIASIIIVTKPYAELRAYLTGRKVLPQLTLFVGSQNFDFYEYYSRVEDKQRFIDMLVGELTRIIDYPKLDYFEAYIVPNEVRYSYEFLKSNGISGRR